MPGRSPRSTFRRGGPRDATGGAVAAADGDEAGREREDVLVVSASDLYTRDDALRWRRDFAGIRGTVVDALAVAHDGSIVVGGIGTGDAPFQTLTFAPGTHYVAVLAP